MSDLDTATDPLASAFAAFHATASAEIRAPGASAARRTVRRGRITTSVVVILAISLSTLGLQHIVSNRSHGNVLGTPAALTVLPLPSLASVPLGRQALDAIADVQAGGSAARAAFYGGGYATLDAASGHVDPTLTGTTPAPGTYEIDLTCQGFGIVHSSWRGGAIDVPCSKFSVDGVNTGGTIVTAGIHLPLPAIDYQLDTDMIGKVGLAFVLTNPAIPDDQLSNMGVDAIAAVADAYAQAKHHGGGVSGSGAKL